MSKDKLTGRNKELLQETALRLGISEDEVLSKVPPIILSMAEFNPKTLGGHLKRMESDKTPEKVLQQQVADDKFGGVVLGFFNKTQENSSQQQEATSNAASRQESTPGWSNYNKYLLETIAILSKKSEDEVLNEIPQDILSEALSNPGYLKEYLKTLRESLKINDSCTNDNPPNSVAAGSLHSEEEMSSAASRQKNTLGWGVHNKLRLKAIAQLSKKSEDEVLKEISQDILSDPECLKDYLAALIESLKINDSCTNDNPSNYVATGSSSAASCQECALTGENLPFNELD